MHGVTWWNSQTGLLDVAQVIPWRIDTDQQLNAAGEVLGEDGLDGTPDGRTQRRRHDNGEVEGPLEWPNGLTNIALEERFEATIVASRLGRFRLPPQLRRWMPCIDVSNHSNIVAAKE